jgi:hypothetical protein
MCAIGLGKHIGCSRLHEEGWPDFSRVVETIAEVYMQKANIGFGLAILENAYDETAEIKAVTQAEILAKEPELQARAKLLMPALLVPDIDVLVVGQLGKNISGAGMDPNIIGRADLSSCFTGPKIKRIVVLDLSEMTHGNASGIGMADFTTKAVFDKLDFTATYANMIAAGAPELANIPVVMENEREAIIAAIRCCGHIDAAGPRIVKIKDTLHLGEIWVSENMLPLIEKDDRLEIAR